MFKTKSFLLAVGVVLAVAFTFSCTSDIESAEDVLGKAESSSSSLQSSSVFCMSVIGCAEISADACSAFGGTIVESCPVSSSSSPPSSSSLGGGFSGSYGSLLYGSLTVKQTYKTVVIGTQTWMAENLNYNPGTGNSVCYNNQESNCSTYGRLYDWSTAMSLPSSCNSSTCSSQGQPKYKGICPSGWHIPSDAEWDVLVTFAGGSSTAGAKLKAKSGWNSNGNGTDDYGFSALPGGYGNSDGSFSNVHYYSYWWSATELNASNAYYLNMYYDDDYVNWGRNKSYLRSVRCLKD